MLQIVAGTSSSDIMVWDDIVLSATTTSREELSPSSLQQYTGGGGNSNSNSSYTIVGMESLSTRTTLLQGHGGVIHSVHQWQEYDHFDDQPNYDNNSNNNDNNDNNNNNNNHPMISKKIISTSDDRSVRLWVLVEQHHQHQHHHHHHQQQQQQQKYHGRQPISKDENDDNPYWVLAWIGWGHTARVWNAGTIMTKLSPQNHQTMETNKTTINSSKYCDCNIVVSVGEDGRIQLWKDESSSRKIWHKKQAKVEPQSQQQHQQQLPQTSAMTLFAPTGLWCLDSTPKLHDESCWLVVGANNGTATIYDFGNHSRATVEGRQPLLWIDTTVQIPDDRPTLSEQQSMLANYNGNFQINASIQQAASPQNPLMNHSDDDNSNDNNPATAFIVAAATMTQQIPKATKKEKKAKKKQLAQVLVGMRWYQDENGILTLWIATRDGSLLRRSAFHATSSSVQQAWTEFLPWWDTSLEKDSVQPTDGCCMTVGLHWIAIGTTRGDIILISTKKGRHRRMVWSGARKWKSCQSLFFEKNALVSFHVRTICWWTLDEGEGYNAVDFPRPLVYRMGTNGVPMSFAYDESSERLVIGDSRGNLALFHHKAATAGAALGETQDPIAPIGVLARVHQKEHVTAVRLHSNKILSVGNDGCICTSFIDDSESAPLRKGWSIPAGSLSGISQIWCICETNDTTSFKGLAVGGYYGNTFVVMDVYSGFEYFRVDTGGRQRNMDCWVEWGNSTRITSLVQYGVAVCISQTDGTNHVMVQGRLWNRPCLPHEEDPASTTFPPLPLMTVGVGMHSETIFDASLFWVGDRTQQHPSWLILLTGSEDCTSRLSLLSNGDDGGTILESISLTPQESCVRAVCASQQDDDHSSTLLVVGGGKLILQFFLVECQDSRHLAQTGLDGLTITFLGHGRTVGPTASVDHRINAVQAMPLLVETAVGIHFVVAGDSNGNGHFFVVAQNKDLKRSKAGRVLPICHRPILCVEMIRVEDRILILFGTTGGDLLMWEAPGTISMDDDWDEFLRQVCTDRSRLGAYQAHQMGTNTISARVKSVDRNNNGIVSTTVLICSGGDDQAICMCEVAFIVNDHGELELRTDQLRPYVTKEASSSAIKGIVQFQDEDETTKLLSVGYSQRLAVWHHCSSDLRDSPGALDLVDRCLVDVGDVNSLASVGAPNKEQITIAVCGQGVEIFTMIK